jgi:hypothetical protein
LAQLRIDKIVTPGVAEATWGAFGKLAGTGAAGRWYSGIIVQALARVAAIATVRVRNGLIT